MFFRCGRVLFHVTVLVVAAAKWKLKPIQERNLKASNVDLFSCKCYLPDWPTDSLVLMLRVIDLKLVNRKGFTGFNGSCH